MASPSRWAVRPSWHGLVYGNGRLGTGRESIVGPSATKAYPIRYGESGNLQHGPSESRTAKGTLTAEDFRKHANRHGGELVNETASQMGMELTKETPLKAKASSLKRHRRTTAYLTKEVIEMSKRGLVVGAIGDSLNISDRRVKEILSAAA